MYGLKSLKSPAAELAYENKVGFAIEQAEKHRAMWEDSDPGVEPGALALQ